MIKQAVFLVGGKGTRLGVATQATPKPLLPIAPGFRFLDAPLEEAARHGFTDIVLLAGHLGEQVEALYQGRFIREARIRVLREAEPAGTAGALRRAADQLAPWFLAANGDTLFDCNLRALTVQPDRRTLGRLALRRVSDAARFGSVELRDGRITSFREKRQGSGGSGLINGGVYALSRRILEYLPEDGSLETDVFPALARDGLLAGLEQSGYFLDIGLPETLAQARREVPERRVRPAAFLDRDSLLDTDHEHVRRVEELAWMPGTQSTVLRLNEAGYFVFVVTDQTGTARGLCSDAEVARLHTRMQERLAVVGAHVDAFYLRDYNDNSADARPSAADRPDSKTGSGMVLRAMAEWPVRRDGSFFVSDRDTDAQAAERAGLPSRLLRKGPLGPLVEALLNTKAGGRTLRPVLDGSGRNGAPLR